MYGKRENMKIDNTMECNWCKRYVRISILFFKQFWSSLEQGGQLHAMHNFSIIAFAFSIKSEKDIEVKTL